MPRLACSLSVATLALLTLAPSARAQAEGPPGETPRYPVAQAERPLTLPKLVLDTEADVDFPHVGGFFGNVSLGASFGIVDDFTVRAVVLPLQLFGPGTAGFHYGQTAPLGDADAPGPGFGLTYRFLRGVVEVGASLDFSIITAAPSSGVSITPGIPVRVHAGRRVRLDTGVYASATRYVGTSTIPEGAGGPMTAATPLGQGSLAVPLRVLCDITEPIHVGVATGFAIANLDQPGTSASIPVGLFAGYALAGHDGPVLDIDPFFTFPTLVTPGVTPVTQAAAYVFGVSVGGFFYL